MGHKKQSILRNVHHIIILAKYMKIVHFWNKTKSCQKSWTFYLPGGFFWQNIVGFFNERTTVGNI